MKRAVKIDVGLNDQDKKKIKSALRKVWSWSFARKLVVKRCDLGGGYSRCEKCRKKVPRIHVDHIEAVGPFSLDIISRMFVPSSKMQGLCDVCHKAKTKTDLVAIKDALDFF